ncbi:hypothetical protein [Arcticibacterium luteifluviistationis]|uniref:Uncharacterized protein n=1 Tax=Arcticibacterium luteifluviistationis TaxID=1784714 RepID=A0A2Z4GF00_9BACT|nr:hypothetical protein [Arcticibacterium luteifluviistationis]AWV99615.1 hypothetical protein DJ013_16125 [Arcticibacterium luteifluviistationis]
MKFRFLTVVVLLTFLTSVNAQKRIGVLRVQGYSSSLKMYKNLALAGISTQGMVSKIVDFYSSNPAFITIDRQNLQLINDEMELQKSEDFMDGYVVSQSKKEGLDYIVASKYDIAESVLTIGIFDVQESKNIGSVSRKLDANFWGVKNMDLQLLVLLLDLNAKSFDEQIPVLRATKFKKDKAKELLVAAGKNLNVREGYLFEIYENVEEKVGAKVLQRQNVIGLAQVISVEDDNFCTMEVEEGEESIMKSLNDKTAVFGRLIID